MEYVLIRIKMENMIKLEKEGILIEEFYTQRMQQGQKLRERFLNQLPKKWIKILRYMKIGWL